MVGVPGRSKGCATCRKRKKGCDFQRPVCGQCLARNVKCGGYDLDLVFISSKYEHPLHSASVRTVEHRDLTLISMAPLASTYYGMPPSLTQNVSSVKDLEAVFHIFPLHEDAGGASQLINQLTKVLTTLSMQEEALRQTIFAIGSIMLGKRSNDQTILCQGRRRYGKALQELRVSLQSPDKWAIEALLATIGVMSLYEILYGVENGQKISHQAKNWISHARGELALIVSRGPKAFTTDAAHVLFTRARYNSALVGVRCREPVVFSQKQWKTIPWRGRSKPASETIIDIFLELPEILAELDCLSVVPRNHNRFDDARLKITAKCWRVHCNLMAWISNNSNEVCTPDIDAPIPIDFPDLGVASVSVRYWATATILYQCFKHALSFAPNDNLSSYLLQPHGRPFARLIVRSVPWLFKKMHGAIGPSIMAFPLGIALMYMRQSEVPDPEYMDLVLAMWNDPEWPSSVRDFLRSMGNSIELPSRKLHMSTIAQSTSALDAIYDIDGNTLGGPFDKPSRF